MASSPIEHDIHDNTKKHRLTLPPSRVFPLRLDGRKLAMDNNISSVHVNFCTVEEVRHVLHVAI